MARAVTATIQRFRIDGVLGEGGMGTVYRAWDPELARPVALKVLASRPSQLELPERHTIDLRAPAPAATTGDQLLAEARLMAQISHPNVLPIYEVGRDGDVVFLVMELVEGDDLRRWMAAVPRTPAAILDAFVDAARGLGAAHARGILHRDLKPDNILIGRDGRVRVADFGVSAMVGGLPAPGAGMARVSGAHGTPAYMAPELWAGGAPSAASDVYALALSAIEALTGQREVDDRPALTARLTARGVTGPRAAALLAAVDPDPGRRPAHGDALAAALTAAAPRRWGLVAAAAVVASSLAIGGVVAATRSGAPSCELDAGRLDGVWSDARARALRARVEGMTGEARVSARSGLAHFDAMLATEADLRRTSCQARARGELGAPAHQARRACLDRRLLELRARAEAAEVVAEARLPTLLGLAPVAECADQRARPVRDRAGQLALYRDLLASYTLRQDRPALLRQYLALEERAVALDDLEMGSRLAGLIGGQYASDRKLDDARAAYLRARERAREIGARSAEVRALVWRAQFELAFVDLSTATVLAQEARAATGGGEVGLVAESELLELEVDLAHQGGRQRDAVAAAARLFALYQEHGREATTEALAARMSQLRACAELGKVDPSGAAACVALADDVLAQVDQVGLAEASPERRRSLFLAAGAHRQAGHAARAEELWQEALGHLRASRPEPGNSPGIHTTHLAGELVVNGRVREGAAMMQEALAYAAKHPDDPLMAAKRGEHLLALGETLRLLGEWRQARVTLEDALLEVTARRGGRSPLIAMVLEPLVHLTAQMGDRDAARRYLGLLERDDSGALAADPKKGALILADARAAVRLLEREPAKAIDVIDQARAQLRELGAPDGDRVGARLRGRALLTLGRFDQAVAELSSIPPEPDPTAAALTASFDFQRRFDLARAERGAGKVAEGDARARVLIEAMAEYPGYAVLRREVIAWLAASPTGGGAAASPGPRRR
jgi:hypothetical protein